MNAVIPAQRCDRPHIAETGNRIADAVETRERECAERRRECATNRPRQGGVSAAVDSDCAQRKLAAKDRRSEGVGRHGECEVGSRIETRAEICSGRDRESADLELARSGDVGSGRHAGVIIDRRERPSGLLRRCCEAAEESGQPEAHAAFVSGCDGRRVRAKNQNKLLKP